MGEVSTNSRLMDFRSDKENGGRTAWRGSKDRDCKERRAAGEWVIRCLCSWLQQEQWEVSQTAVILYWWSEEWCTWGQGTLRTGSTRTEDGACPQHWEQPQPLCLWDRPGSIEIVCFPQNKFKTEMCPPGLLISWLRVSLLSTMNSPQGEQTAAFKSETQLVLPSPGAASRR